MYIPSAFKVDHQKILHDLMSQRSFATLVTVDESGTPFVTHLPFLLTFEEGEHGMLRGHVARANPQWGHFATGKETLVVFQGPHAYISPSWYHTQPSVPTWNYAAVHAYGVPEIMEEAELAVFLADMVTVYEGGDAEQLNFDMPQDYVRQMMHGIVGFRIPISRLEGKFKMSQNRSDIDRAQVLKALKSSGRELNAETAALMETFMAKEALV